MLRRTGQATFRYQQGSDAYSRDLQLGELLLWNGTDFDVLAEHVDFSQVERREPWLHGVGADPAGNRVVFQVAYFDVLSDYAPGPWNGMYILPLP